jgi:hypothetical protein
MNIFNKIKGASIAYASKPLMYTATADKLCAKHHQFTQLTDIQLNTRQQKVWYALSNQRKQNLITIMSHASPDGRLHAFTKNNTDIMLDLATTSKRLNKVLHDVDNSRQMGDILRNNYGEFKNLRLPKKIDLSNLMQGNNEVEKNRIQDHFDAWETEPLESERLLYDNGHRERENMAGRNNIGITNIHSSSAIVGEIFHRIQSTLPKLENDELDQAYTSLKDKLNGIIADKNALTIKIKQEMNIAPDAILDEKQQCIVDNAVAYRLGRVEKAYNFLNDAHVTNNTGEARKGFSLKQIIVGLVALSATDASFWSDKTQSTEMRQEAFLNELIEKMAEAQVGYGGSWKNTKSEAAYKSCFAGAVERVILSMQIFVDMNVMPSSKMYKSKLNEAIITVLNDLGDEEMKRHDPAYANARNKNPSLLKQLYALKIESAKLKHSDLTLNKDIWKIIKKSVFAQMKEEFPACKQSPLTHKNLWRRTTNDKIMMQAVLENISLPRTFRVAMGLPEIVEDTKPKENQGVVLSKQMQNAGFTPERLAALRAKQNEAREQAEKEDKAEAERQAAELGKERP